MTRGDEDLHVAEKECQDQRADVRTVDVGVRHNDDLAVAQLSNIEFRSDAATERGNHGPNFLVAQHLVVTRFLDV